MTSPSNRRGFLRGFALVSATTATGVLALPAAAEPAVTNPDAELLAAFADTERLEAGREAARKIARAAGRAARRDEGPIPEELMLNAEENTLCRGWGRVGQLHFGPRFRWRHSREPNPNGLYFQPDPGWTGAALRKAIEHAVTDLGPAGRTPPLLRRWRGLLPIADAYDQRVTEAHLRHRTRELHDDEQQIDKALSAARARVQAMPATSREGLVVQVRMFDGIRRENIPQHVLPLLLSAAAVAGTAVKFYEDNERS